MSYHYPDENIDGFKVEEIPIVSISDSDNDSVQFIRESKLQIIMKQLFYISLNGLFELRNSMQIIRLNNIIHEIQLQFVK